MLYHLIRVKVEFVDFKTTDEETEVPGNLFIFLSPESMHHENWIQQILVETVQ